MGTPNLYGVQSNVPLAEACRAHVFGLQQLCALGMSGVPPTHIKPHGQKRKIQQSVDMVMTWRVWCATERVRCNLIADNLLVRLLTSQMNNRVFDAPECAKLWQRLIWLWGYIYTHPTDSR